jgi:hypothetical protein
MSGWTLKVEEVEDRIRSHSAPSGVGGQERNANKRVRDVKINVFIY